jgi:hypothetical protein
MRERLKSRRARLALLVVSAMLVGGGSAIAYFASTGSGTGQATVGHPDPITISAGADPTATEQLYPGSSGSVTAKITNPNPFPVRVNSLVLDTTQGSNGFSGPGGCDLSVLSYTTQTNGGAGWTVPKHVASDGELDLDLTNAISMSTSAANACQGGSFTVYLKVGP